MAPKNHARSHPPNPNLAIRQLLAVSLAYFRTSDMQGSPTDPMLGTSAYQVDYPKALLAGKNQSLRSQTYRVFTLKPCIPGEIRKPEKRALAGDYPEASRTG